MPKISAKTVKKTSLIVSSIWIISFLVFMLFMTRINPNISLTWAKPLATGFVTLIGGLVMLAFCIVYTIAAWSMPADEHHDMLVEISFFGRLNEHSLSILPKSYWLWQNRILMLLVIPLALILASNGINTLAMAYMAYLE